MSTETIIPTAPTTITPIITETATPVIDETSNWQTHNNAENKFSFKYPQEYFKYVREDTSGNSIYLAPTEGKGEAAGTPLILTPDDVWFLVSTTIAKPNQQNSSKETISLNGPQPTSSFQTIMINNGQAIKIEMISFSKNTLTKYESMFDKILSTFKFVNRDTSL